MRYYRNDEGAGGRDRPLSLSGLSAGPLIVICVILFRTTVARDADGASPRYAAPPRDSS